MDLASFSQANTNSYTVKKVSEPNRLTSTRMPQYVVNHHPVVLYATNPGNLQSNSSVGNNITVLSVSNPTLIGRDILYGSKLM